MEIFMYFFTITLQLSGGIILLINNIVMSPVKLGEAYCKGSTELEFEEEKGEVKVEPARLEGILKEIYLNRIAFIYLILGYALSVFGDFNNFNVWVAVFVIIAFSLIISYISYKVVSKVAVENAKKDKYKNYIRENITEGTVVISYEK